MPSPRRVLLLLAALFATSAAAGPASIGGQTGAVDESVLARLSAALAAGDVGAASSVLMLVVGLVGIAWWGSRMGRDAVKALRQRGVNVVGTLMALVAAAAIAAAIAVVAVGAAVPASTSTSTSASTSTEIAWVKITQADSVATFDAAIAAAKAAHMPVMIDFGAAWCIACKELDRSTFVDAAVRAEAARFVSIKVDTTDETAALNAIQERFGVVGLPHIAFIGSDGVYLDAATQAPRYEPVTGLLKAAEFLPQLQRVH